MLNRNFFIAILTFGTLGILARAKALGAPEKKLITNPIKDTIPFFDSGKKTLITAFDHGRAHLNLKGKRILKSMYPFLLVVVFAKLIVVPLILKLLITATSSAFVMSKIALVTSALIALSWLLGLTNEKTKLQIVQYPTGGASKFYGGWNANEKYTPYYTSEYVDWPYDGGIAEHNEKNSFI